MGQVYEEDFNRCRRPRCWSVRVQRRCPSGVGRRCRSGAGSPHCLIPLRSPCLIPGRTLRRANRAGTRRPILTGSSCSRCPTAPSRTAAAPSSSSLDGRCPSRRPRSLRSAAGCPAHCQSGSCLHPSRCRTRYASCGRPPHQIQNHSLFVVCMGERVHLNPLRTCFSVNFHLKVYAFTCLQLFSVHPHLKRTPKKR